MFSTVIGLPSSLIRERFSGLAGLAGVLPAGPAPRPLPARVGPPYRDVARSRQASVHEAGHGATVRKVLGADCLIEVFVNSSPDDGSWGGCIFHPVEGITAREQGLVYAGGPALARLMSYLYSRAGLPVQRSYGEDGDRESFAAAGLHLSLWPEYVDEAERLLRPGLDALFDAAGQLLDVGRLTGREFDRILRGV